MKIKFLTINIWFGGKVWDNLIEYIRHENPDILAIQEVYDGHDEILEPRFRTMDEFRKEFRNTLKYDTFGATVHDIGVDFPWGNAIFSKFPISNSHIIFFDLPFSHYDFQKDPDPRLAAEGILIADVELNSQKITVGSWHGVWDHHGGDTPNRKLMGEKIIEGLVGQDNLILAGDTNMNPDSETILKIQNDLNLKSVFGTSLTTTFNMKQKEHPGNYANSPVDMVLYSPKYEVISKRIDDVDISDHFPLIVEFEV